MRFEMAFAHDVRHSMLYLEGRRCDPCQGRRSLGVTMTGGVAALNPRLQAVTPAGVEACNFHFLPEVSLRSTPG
jgi:hypothetical protein